MGLKEGYYRVRSRIGWQVWATERVLDMARDLLFPIYASLFTPVWLRLLGAKVGKNVEASTVLLLPKMTTVGEGAFLADDTMVASYELGGGWMRIAPAKIGKRSFLGNSGMTAAGRNVPKNSLVAVLSATPSKAKSGTSWLGSPPVRLRRTAVASDDTRTFQPPPEAEGRQDPVGAVPLRAGHADSRPWPSASWSSSIGWQRCADYGAAAALGGLVLLLAGGVAAASAVAAKWLLVGRIRAGEHPLWSSFIWRNEVVDTFIEMVSAPWFARAATGTPALVWWLRALGAKIGRGTWCESYWLPEADLVTLGAQLHGQPRLRGPDPPLPRPRHEHRHCYARRRSHHGPARRHPAAGTDRQRRNGGPGVPGDAGRDRPGRDVLDGQPGEPLDGPAVPAPRLK